MIQILFDQRGNPGQLRVDGTKSKFPEVRVRGTSKVVRIHIRKGELVPLIASHPVSDLPEEMEVLSIDNLHTFLPEQEFNKQSVSIFKTKEGNLRLGLSFSPNTNEWKHLWSIREYSDEFRRIVETRSQQGFNIRFGGKLASISINPALTVNFPIESITASIYSEALNHENVVQEIHALTEVSLESNLSGPKVEQIIRSIEFPPEYHRSGITILSYFADVLRHKNLSEDVKVSIEQSGLNVSLVIDSPTGQREILEHTLEAYALVVTGKQPIETLTTDPYEVAELKSQLRIASAQIETQRDLLTVKNSEVASLRIEVEDTKDSLDRLAREAREDKARFMMLLEDLVE